MNTRVTYTLADGVATLHLDDGKANAMGIDMLRKVDLGEKGTFYRALVPAGSSGEAAELCSGMKAAGGSCLVQKN